LFLYVTSNGQLFEPAEVSVSYEFYKILHQVGLFMVFLSLGAYLLNALADGGRQFMGRRLVMITHGIGMLAVFVAGFGLIARLQIPTPWPMWIYLKLGIWLLIGGMLMVAMRKSSLAGVLWVLAIVLGGTAAYLARVKPF
jgi:hypothetical protein